MASENRVHARLGIPAQSVEKQSPNGGGYPDDIIAIAAVDPVRNVQ